MGDFESIYHSRERLWFPAISWPKLCNFDQSENRSLLLAAVTTTIKYKYPNIFIKIWKRPLFIDDMVATIKSITDKVSNENALHLNDSLHLPIEDRNSGCPDVM